MVTILVGVDLSGASELAAEHALDRARRTAARLVLALVEDPPEPVVGSTPLAGHAAASYRQFVAEDRAEHDRRLTALAARLADRGVEVSHRVLDGHPDEQLAKAAEELDAALVVVGSDGHTGVEWLRLGSVAERVARFAARNVLVVRGPAPTQGYHRVVVGTDFSELAQLAVEQALALAAPRARVEVVHCRELPWLQGSALDERTLALSAEGEAVVESLRARTDADVRFRLLQRAPSRGIVELARELGADLVVVGSHGRRGVRRWILGSVAEVTARHAPCSTLIARGPAR